MQALYDTLKQRFALGEFTQQRDDLAFLSVDAIRLYAVLRYLRDHEGFTHLVLLTAVDWIEDEQFQLTYLLHNRPKCQDIGLRVMIPRDPATMESIHDLWPAAATYQRELYEMFGIDFPGSPRIDEEFILEGWHNTPPYRRDFDTLEYARETYRDRPGRETHDPAAHMKKQLYGDD
ncbi:NADH-quinone oxidoreductase subunit C [Candidatus Thiothrix sp. Deng01]|uniref:NADH-quinone oxidoreductase subunit C n=1 Tax=Candidatus Thiothrix phosphatis TaxID=3112415 RepID=A0ABU6CY02_9GAMM|nr:NADH-quinone oxidoreductase subunit C [Candidatus Thiothrix sp. Deng01]MEB4591715.1 NADH-quinone oxidoreductase subunit C [Candidatus Thiothrix sp. Deng01]